MKNTKEAIEHLRATLCGTDEFCGRCNDSKEAIDSLEKELDTARTLLNDLADLQNGAPLETHRKEWEETMAKVYDFFGTKN